MFEPLDYEDDRPQPGPRKTARSGSSSSARRAKKRGGGVHRFFDAIWNLLSILILLATLVIGGLFVMVYTNPYGPLNPFPPPTLPALLGQPTVTGTPLGWLPPTWTPQPTATATAAPTDRPTATLPPTATFFSLTTPSPMPPTETPTRQAGGWPFVVQTGFPKAIANIAHPEQGCNWMGIAGQVTDLNGGPKTQLIVVLGGTLEGRMVHSSGAVYSLTGVATQYGQSGYEFVLRNEPIESKKTLWVQLVDQQEIPLSDKILFDTFADCEKNLVMINFKQVR